MKLVIGLIFAILFCLIGCGAYNETIFIKEPIAEPPPEPLPRGPIARPPPASNGGGLSDGPAIPTEPTPEPPPAEDKRRRGDRRQHRDQSNHDALTRAVDPAMQPGQRVGGHRRPRGRRQDPRQAPQPFQLTGALAALAQVRFEPGSLFGRHLTVVVGSQSGCVLTPIHGSHRSFDPYPSSQVVP